MIEQKSKITFKGVYNPKKFMAALEIQKRIELGVIIGRATGIKVTELPDGTAGRGLEGVFVAFRGDPGQKDGVKSGVLYLPAGFDGPIIDALKSGAEGVAVEFAQRVFMLEDGNPQGYTYATVDLRPPTVDDPLEALVKLASVPAAPAIAAPDAPEAAPAGKKG